jgi:hypothetical protein
MEELSKKDRQEQLKLQREAERVAEERKAKMKKFVIWFLVLGILGSLGYWGIKELFKPLPGTLYPDLGREHVNDISDITYNSNPPTSGTHFPAWAKKGVYDRVISDGYLIHSLEHGYIVISYDCGKTISNITNPTNPTNIANDKWGLVPFVYAEDQPSEEKDQMEDGKEIKPLTQMKIIPTNTKSWVTPDDQPGIEVELPEEFKSESCKSLVSDLSSASSNWDRIVIVPRVGMDHPIALTAWRRLETLDAFDKGKIQDFIKAFHNRGPEQTME